MRRRAAPFLFSLTLAGVTATLAAPALTAPLNHEQSRVGGGVPPAMVSRPSGPPHAWLFGTWTGGLFPVLEGMAPQDCRTQPTVVFAQDVVGHTSLTGAAMTRRVIETVRTSPTGAEFRFTPDVTDTGAFGCDDSNTLHVVRESNDSVSFPRCAAFPYPLQRCPAPAR